MTRAVDGRPRHDNVRRMQRRFTALKAEFAAGGADPRSGGTFTVRFPLPAPEIESPAVTRPRLTLTPPSASPAASPVAD